MPYQRDRMFPVGSIMSRVFAIPVMMAFFSLPLVAESHTVFSFVQSHCANCHNNSAKAGDLDFSSKLNGKTFEDNRDLWQKVAERVKLGQMPPPGMPRPPAEASAATVRWLESEFARQDALIQPQAGRVTARRLNRAEYNNTVRDLLGIDIRPADTFPADTAAFGFDNISDALTLSPALLENYVDAAERAVRTALFGPERRKPA